MKKAELAERLDDALALLKKCEDEPRIRKATKEKIEVFASETRKALAAASANGSGRSIWRIGEARNERTGKTVVLELKADGGLLPSDAARLGIEHVEEWHEVRASSRVDARERIAAGEGTRFRRTKGGKVKKH